ncbi:MAG TPA: hypothetical protein VGH20_00775 [Myxococcales bacterium]
MAEALATAIGTTRDFASSGLEGPWEWVDDVLSSVDLALRTRDVTAFAELAKTARAEFERMWFKATVESPHDRVVADFLLDIRRPLRRPIHLRLKTLAAFAGENSKTVSVRVEVYRTAQLLPRLLPEFRFKYKADEKVIFRPHPFSPSLEEFRDEFSRHAREVGLNATQERRMAAFLARHTVMRLPATGDGRAIVRAAARFCGLAPKDVQNLFASAYVARHRAKKQGRRPAEL